MNHVESGSAYSLLEHQLAVLLKQDARGRLVATRGPTARPAPRVFLGRSADGNVWATRRDLDPDMTLEIERLCAAEPRLADPSHECAPSCREQVLELLAPVELEYRGPCYVLPELLPMDPRAREIALEEVSKWQGAFPWLVAEFGAVAPVAVAFEDGQPAAICHCPRGLTDHAAEAGVETLEPFRRCGLATAAVARWAHAVQQKGRLALYSTSWQNTASQALAHRLSGQLYGENWHVT
jgi:hypothetical protein